MLLLLPIGGLLAPVLELAKGECTLNKSNIELDDSILLRTQLQEFLDKRSYNIISTERKLKIRFGENVRILNKITESLGPISERRYITLLKGLGILEMVILIPIEWLICGATSTKEYIRGLAKHCTLEEILRFMIHGQDVRIKSLSGNETIYHLKFSWNLPESVHGQLMRFRVAEHLPKVACRYAFHWKDGMPTMTRVVICPKLIFREEQMGGGRIVRVCRFDFSEFPIHVQNSANSRSMKGMVFGDIDSEDQLKDARVEFISKDAIPEDVRDLMGPVHVRIFSEHYLRIANDRATIIFRLRSKNEESIKKLKKVVTNVSSAFGYLLGIIDPYLDGIIA